MAGAPTGEVEAFAPRELPKLRAAVDDLCWLLARGYAEGAASTLVGDHSQLTRLQRQGVRRCACADPEVRIARRRARSDRVAIDGFNQLVTAERALAGGVVLRGRDGALRDVAGVHGTWRRTEGTEAALDAILGALSGEARVVLDAPVSNSGRLAALIRARGVPCDVVDAADRHLLALAAEGWTLATSDGALIGRVAWISLVEGVAAARAVAL